MKVTIVTVVYNGEDYLEETILSVINQTYKNIEYIVIDGGSKDKTLDIIKKYENNISYWSSEPDKGIYDAMNKGIIKATGEWINFMNAGDSFCNDDVLSKIFNELSDSDIDIIYGNTQGRKENKLKQYIPASLNLLKKRMPFCHQSSFVKTSLLKSDLFDLSYRIAADYNLFYRLYKYRKKFRYFNMDIAIYDLNGISENKGLEVIKEYGHIQGVYNTLSFKLYFFKRSVIFYVKKILQF